MRSWKHVLVQLLELETVIWVVKLDLRVQTVADWADAEDQTAYFDDVAGYDPVAGEAMGIGLKMFNAKPVLLAVVLRFVDFIEF